MNARVALPVLLVLSPVAVADEPAAPPDRLRGAITRAIGPLERSLLEYPRHRDCFSCHNQAMPALALTLARDRGFPVRDDGLEAALDVTLTDLESALEDYRKGRGQGGGATRAGYALLTLELLAHPPDETTAAVSGFLLAFNADRDHWRTSSDRPPSEASPFTTTYVALRALRAFPDPDPGSIARLRERSEAARSWLLKTPPRDTEDRVFRLLALGLLAADPAALTSAADDLLSHQNADGGWSQIAGRPSDAYATGSALVALHRAGSIPTDHPAFRRGLAFLLSDQLDDGTWHVRSRSKPFQTYFESGFPHGPDQFLSAAASSWATAALVLACPPAATSHRDIRTESAVADSPAP